VHNLARGGFIKSHRGKGGGIELARKHAKVNIDEAVRYKLRCTRAVECFDWERNRSVIANFCGLTEARAACDNFSATLDRYTLADLLERRARLATILATASNRE